MKQHNNSIKIGLFLLTFMKMRFFPHYFLLGTELSGKKIVRNSNESLFINKYNHAH